MLACIVALGCGSEQCHLLVEVGGRVVVVFDLYDTLQGRGRCRRVAPEPVGQPEILGRQRLEGITPSLLRFEHGSVTSASSASRSASSPLVPVGLRGRLCAVDASVPIQLGPHVR
ncbi:hypothetical protein BRC76_03205 [Halobacteriales archaeon QH_8_67_36]|nr:MAG: hypothetical protein BRC76_03205 [Halobacteriales archaeon QH_8_67_36]